MPTERFRFREDVLRAAAGRTRRRFATTLVTAAAVIVLVWSAALRPRGAGWGTLAFSLVLLLALAALSVRRRMRRLHERWRSFEIAIDGEGISRQVSGVALRIARGEVESVGERADGIVVRARGGAALLVPREIDGYARVREALAGWAAPPGAGGPA